MAGETKVLTVKAISEGFENVIRDMQKLASESKILSDKMDVLGDKSDKSQNKLNKGFTLGKFMAGYLVIKQITHGLSTLIDLSNNYVENLNLFTVQMGKYAEQGQKFIGMLNQNLGINPSDAMRYMGFFMNLAQGMGVASKQSFIMSKNLTALGYDLSSFLNIPIDQAMLKIQSGIAGELEPLRRVGYALSVNTMQAYLNKYSAQAKQMESSTSRMTEATRKDTNMNILNAKYIGAKVLGLTDAEKVQLRYAIIMEETVKAQGDMARTLVAPANQLRILGENAKLTGMALGNILIPFLQLLMPVAIAVMQVIRDVANSIAKLFGFKLPVIDYSSLKSGSQQFSTNVNNANKGLAETKKRIKDLSAPFDELNVINKTPTSSGGSSGTGTGGTGSGIGGTSAMFDKLQEYDSWLQSNLMKHIADIKQKIEDWLPVIVTVATAFLAWKSMEGIATTAENVAKVFKTFSKEGTIGKLFAEGGFFANLFKAGGLFGKGGLIATAFGALEGLLAGVASAIGISVGWLIAIIAGIAVAIYLIVKNWDSITKFFTETIPAWWNGTVIPFFQGVITAIGDWFKGIPDFFKGIFDAVVKTFEDWGVSIWNFLTVTIPNFVTQIVTWFASLPEKIGYAIGYVIGTLAGWAVNIYNWITTEVPLIIGSIVDWFAGLPKKIYDGIILVIGKFVVWKTNVETWVTDHVSEIITNILNWFKGLPDKILTAINNIKNTIIRWKDNVIDWVSTYVPLILNSIINWFADLPSALVNIGSNMIKGLWNGIISAKDWFVSKLKNFFGGAWDLVSDFFEGFGEGTDTAYSKVTKFASGGFPSTGQMFLARESGAELVGTIGSKTAVINNNQILQGIAQGVHGAVVSAMAGMGGGGSNQPIVLQLDGDVIWSNQQQVGARKGLQMIQSEYAR